MKGLHMKTFVTVTAIVVVLAGCGKTAEPVSIQSWQRYQDPYFKATFSYPRDWHVVTEPGKVSVFSSTEVMEKFYDPTSQGKTGLQLIVSYEKLDTLKSLDEYVNAWQGDLKASGFTVSATTRKTIDGEAAVQVEYSGQFTENTKLGAIRAYAMVDSVLYYAHYGAFNEMFAPNRFLFDSLANSLKFIRVKPTASPEELTKPSVTFTDFSNNLLQISYPDNFETGFPPPKGGAEFSMELKGYRQDCTIHIDILPAQKLTVDKVVEQNSKFYKPKSRGAATIDGVKVIYLNYSPARSIDSRVYFLVKNDKVYRILFNIFQPLSKDYLPVFEKTIASIHVK